MSYIYEFNPDPLEDILSLMASNLQKRRLEKGLSRISLSKISGVPVPTIAKFEQKHAISLSSYVMLAKALGYTDEIKHLLSESLYNTMQELDSINMNKNRKRGRRDEANK